MKKISIIALVLVLTAGLMTACRRPMEDAMTNPSTQSTAPSTVAPTAGTTVPTTEATRPTSKPTEPSGTTAPGNGTINPGDGTIDGTTSIDSTETTGKSEQNRRRNLPRY